MNGSLSQSDVMRFVERAARGDEQAWQRLMGEHRARLRRMIAFRLDRRLQGRVDPSDVLQDAYIDATRRLPEYARAPSMPFYLWLRFLASQRLTEQHRRHLGAQARDARRDVSLQQGDVPDNSAAELAQLLFNDATTPSEAAARIEQSLCVQRALESLEPIDREILLLRHFEQLSNGEAAGVLGLDKSAASKRYVRALTRLKDALLSAPGGPDAWGSHVR